MQLIAIDHIVLTTSDIRKCVSFYEGILGMKHECPHGRHILKFGNRGGRIIAGPVERTGARGVMDSIYLYDPDGNLVEIAVYR